MVFYSKSNQRQPVKEFLATLNTQERARILACLKNIEELGFESPRVQFRQIKGTLWEIKIRLASGQFRIFYVAIKNHILVLLHAYKKQSQKAPKNEIEIAEKRMKEILNYENDYA